MSEIWADVPEYENHYKVSNLGHVVSLKNRFGLRKKPHYLRPSSYWHKYLQVSLCKDSVAKAFKIHRLVMLAFIGPRPSGLTINHINGVKTDNRLENLEYITVGDNCRHAVRLGIHRGKNRRSNET